METGSNSSKKGPVAFPESSALSVRSILAAEDNEVNRVILVEMLEILGYRVDAVEDGECAVELAVKSPYVIILMDCQMPGLDGYEATRRIRDAESASGRGRTPIVAISGCAGVADRARCLEADMDDLIAKPFTFEDLQTMVRKWDPAGGA